jgi:hypothetical protein
MRLACILAIGLVAGCGGQAPTRVFEAVLKSPVPSSVVIINSDEAGGLSRCSWVHFRATSADIATLLRAHPFGVQANSSDDFSSLSPPPWWTPASLGPGRATYRWDHKVDEDVTETRILVHNSASNEVFAVFFSNW